MEMRRSTYTSIKKDSALPPSEIKTKTTKKARGDCFTPTSSSHTKFLSKSRHEEKYETITREKYFGETESISTTDSMGCVHGPEGKKYTAKGLLKRNILKILDPQPLDSKLTSLCPLSQGWDMVEDLVYLIRDPTVSEQMTRVEQRLKDFIMSSKDGFRIDKLDGICTILDYIVEMYYNKPHGSSLKKLIVNILENMEKPILLNVASDVVTYFEPLRNYLGFLGYLLIRMQDDELFDFVSRGIIWQLSYPDKKRGGGTAHLRHTLSAAAPVLYQTATRMFAVSVANRFPTFLEIALLLACDSVDNCIQMMKENVLENIFYRFNPYFPHRKLPIHDIGPLDVDDSNVLLGDSQINMNKTLSLLLILLKTTLDEMKMHPEYKSTLPCPNGYGQLCFIWAYRYECRAREHRHQRITLTVIISALLKCFGSRLQEFSALLMPDVLSLSVLTEIPPRSDWTKTVNFNTAQEDVQFKKMLIYTTVGLLRTFPVNKFMIESRKWLIGIMYLLDPGLSSLRANWAPSLFAEIRNTALQALVCVLPLISPTLVINCGIIRRLLWYIEWYSESPYELSVLYWCLRVLQVAIYQRNTKIRKLSIKDLFDSHGIIILIQLCHTLLNQKMPPVEKSQVVIALTLRLLTSAIEIKNVVACCVYPEIKWPISINSLAKKMLDVVLFSLKSHLFISDRWLVSLLNFIWEGIIWNDNYRTQFISNSGVYMLLDIITVTRPTVQCIALALLCDIARLGDAVGFLITWRAGFAASNVSPVLVHRGKTIATLLAAVFRDDCKVNGIRLDDDGVIQDLQFPLMSSDHWQEIKNSNCQLGKSQTSPDCFAVTDLFGSRMSKAFALVQLLSEDLEYKVSITDEAYNLYKNINLCPADEATLVLCSHYLTLKLNEVWMEIHLQCPNLLPQDSNTVDEFIDFGKGWAKEIKRQQERVLEIDTKKETQEERSLYAFLGRVRLNIALDALREVRCVSRSADSWRMMHSLLQDAVKAHHRRSNAAEKILGQVLRTYDPPLDDQNMTGQYVKVYSINPKEKTKPQKDGRLS